MRKKRTDATMAERVGLPKDADIAEEGR